MELLRQLCGVLIFVILFSCSAVQADEEKTILCYFEFDLLNLRDGARYTVENIDTSFCTHLVYNTIVLDIEVNEIRKFSDVFEQAGENEKNIDTFKAKNPQLKVLVTVNVHQYSWPESLMEMMANTSYIDKMAANIVEFLHQNKFDGVSLEISSFVDERHGLPNLLKKMKSLFLTNGFTLAVVGGLPENELDYDEFQLHDYSTLSQDFDMFILDAYNFHRPDDEPKLADHHAPLYNRPWDKENKTVDFVVDYWIGRGLPPNKIILGLPFWGNSWKLATSKTSPPARAIGKAPSLKPSSRMGIIGYYEICQAIENKKWVVFQDPNHTMGPYAVSPVSEKATWVGYDDPAMMTIKSKYILSKGLGGAAVSDVAYDDFRNRCGGGKNPLLKAIRKVLTPDWTHSANPKKKATSTTTSTTTSITTSTTTSITTSTTTSTPTVDLELTPKPTILSDKVMPTSSATSSIPCPFLFVIALLLPKYFRLGYI